MPVGAKATRRPNPIYFRLIMESTGCTEDQTIEVEEVMRCERPTLDALTRPEFKRLAKRSFEAAKQLGWIK